MTKMNVITYWDICHFSFGAMDAQSPISKGFYTINVRLPFAIDLQFKTRCLASIYLGCIVVTRRVPFPTKPPPSDYRSLQNGDCLGANTLAMTSRSRRVGKLIIYEHLVAALMEKVSTESESNEQTFDQCFFCRRR
jgi:hypothetical protein